MPHLALNIDMANRIVLIAGGGRVAERKIRALLDADISVHVVSPQVTPEIVALSESGHIHLKLGNYETGDLDGVFLVVAATNDPSANRSIAEDAFQQGILVNVTDKPESGNCLFPAMLRRGGLSIAVSTQGKCPAVAAEIRDLIATIISEEYGPMLENLAAEREKLLTEGSPSTYNATILRSRTRELIDEFMDHKDRVP
jgi:precorrin-2 dehydrogenase/sirohydrochlorin ferrochelatase